MKIQEALEKFLIQLEADGRSQHTIKQYARHIRLFSHWRVDVGPCCDVSKITHETIASFLSSSQARTRPDGRVKKATSVNALRSSLKGFFGYLHQAGFIRYDPTRLTRRAICGRSKPRALSESEKERLLGALGQGEGPEAERDHVLFCLMLSTGIRLGSALGLDVKDVDLERGEMRLNTTKGNRPEKVYLSKGIRDHLEQYISEQPTVALFTGRNGNRISKRHVQRRFSQWLEKAEIIRTASVHCLRHTFASHLYRRTGDIFLVKEALRHRSIASTLVYAQLQESRLREVFAVQ